MPYSILSTNTNTCQPSLPNDRYGHVAEHCDLFDVDLPLFSDDDGSRTVTDAFGVVESRGLEPLVSLMSDTDTASSQTVGGGNTGPCSSGGGDAMLLALDMSGRVFDDSRRAEEDSPPVMKFSSLSTHAS